MNDVLWHTEVVNPGSPLVARPNSGRLRRVTTNFGLNSGIDGRDTSSGTQIRGARIFARVRPALFAAADLPQALFGHIWDL